MATRINIETGAFDEAPPHAPPPAAASVLQRQYMTGDVSRSLIKPSERVKWANAVAPSHKRDVIDLSGSRILQTPPQPRSRDETMGLQHPGDVHNLGFSRVSSHSRYGRLYDELRLADDDGVPGWQTS